MKRKIYVSAVLVLCVGLFGCGKTPEQPVDSVTEVTETVSVEPESTEEITAEAETETAPAASVSSELSDDPYSFQISVGGEIYQLPMTFEQLVSYGWEYDGDVTQTLDPNQYTFSDVFKKGDAKIYAKICNFGADVMAIDKCTVGSLTFDSMTVEDNQLGIFLPGGIEFLKSTKEDIVAAYGEPTDTYESDSLITLTYTYDYHQEIKLNISVEKNVLDLIDIENLVPMEDSAAEDTAVSDEVPEIISQYTAPTALGDDFTKFIVELDGDLYQIPAPVAEFEKNGWKIIEDSSDSVIKAKDFGWITLTKNNQKMRTSVQNYAPNATTINNTFVTKVVASDNEAKLPIKVQKGIERGMKQADVEKALSGVSYEEDESETFLYYEIAGPNSSLDAVTILVNKETGVVGKIEVSNQPKSDELFK